MKRTLAVAALLLGNAMTIDGQEARVEVSQQVAARGSAGAMPADCDYDRCSLRFTMGFGSWSVLQGAEAKRVGRISGFQVPDIARLVETVPEASEEAKSFRRDYRRSMAMIWGGSALTLLGVGLAAGNDAHPLAVGLSLGGVAAMTYGAWGHGRSFDHLSRSLWLFNRSLRR
jgi:hypothetical protein